MAADPKWIKDLSSKVQAAVKEIAKLRRQNKSLKTQLDKAKTAAKKAEKAAATPAKPDPRVEAWRTERKEVRRRVVRLAKKLEELG